MEAREAELPDVTWSEAPAPLATKLAATLFDASDAWATQILADIVRVEPLATEKGRNAILNSTPDRVELGARFSELGNDLERAWWTLIHRPEVFKSGEELHFVDYYAEGSRGRAFRTAKALDVSREEADLRAFEQAICRFYRGRDGSGSTCHAEVADRHADGSVQITLYVQGLPHHTAEFFEGAFQRRLSVPAVEAAVVYHPGTGDMTTVARGGREAHDALRSSFCRFVLKAEPEFERAVPRPFVLEGLKHVGTLDADPADGIRLVRVRRLQLSPLDGRGGMLALEAPPSTTRSVHDEADRWFVERTGIYDRFRVTEATICVHLHPVPGKRGRAFNIRLTLPNSSNLKSLKEGDRQIAEKHIDEWQLVGGPQV